MTPKTDKRRNRWPTKAEDARMEALATAARIRELVLRAEECISRGNRDEAMRLLSLIHDKANNIEDILRKAHDGKWRDKED